MRSEEAERASGFGRVLGTICFTAIVFMPFLEGTTWLKWASIATVTMLGVVSLWVWREARAGRYSVRTFRVFGVAALFAAPVIQVYFGVFSPAPLVVTLGISFFGAGDDKRFTSFMIVIATASYAIPSTLILVGVVDDPGLISGLMNTPLELGFFVVIVPLIYSISFWQARLTRKTTHRAVDWLHEAMGLAQVREAQLAEAHQNLEHALQAGAGQSGRFTGLRAGNYVLAELLGRGGMGEVYAALHVESQDRFAVKLLPETNEDNPDLMARFRREAEITSRLHHPNVVAVYDVGEAGGGMPYLVMELLRGNDLAWHLRKKGRLSVEDAVSMVEEVALGLQAAHEAGVVHRDVKPPNLFLAERADGAQHRWKILDFGVSKVRGSGGTLTEHAIIGTPAYMSPEQARGIEADERSDTFSLAAVAYRSLTGRPPFSGVDTPRVLFEIVFRNPKRPTAVMASLHRDFDRVLALALAKEPDERFRSPAQLASALRDASRGKLDAQIRARGDAMSEKYPWGKVPVAQIAAHRDAESEPDDDRTDITRVLG